MLRREWDRREASLVAANQALLTPAQIEKVRSLEQGESVGHSYSAAIHAAILVDPCPEARTDTDISPTLTEHLGIDATLLQQLEARNAAFTKSLAEQMTQRSNNDNRIRIVTSTPQIDIEELGRLYAAQIAIDREVIAQRKRHTIENRTLLPESVLEKLRQIETVARSKSTLDEVRDLHLLKQRWGYFLSYGPSCQ